MNRFALSARSFIQLVWLPSIFMFALFFAFQSNAVQAATLDHALAAPLAATTLQYYVDVDSPSGAPNGLAWSTAFTNVQDALSVAATLNATNTVQIWVAEGTYYPDEGIGQTNNSISSTFQLRTNVELYGGFIGTETALSQRDWIRRRTVLSGDVDRNGAFSNNTYHVLNGSNVTNAAELNGFVVTGGSATDSNSNSCLQICGGGIFIETGNPTLTNLLFVDNIAKEGGAIYNLDNSRPVINNVIFTANRALSNGGAMHNNGSNLTLSNVTFYSNTATNGGAIYNTNISASGPQIRNTIFWQNSASVDGADVHNATSSASVITRSLTIAGCPTGSTCGSLLTSNPKFIDADGADNLPGTSDDNLNYLATSPVVDAGSNTFVHASIVTDYNNSLRTVDGDGNGTSTVDLGAYEYQGFDLYTSLSVTPTVVAPGARITYTLQFSNSGPLPATGIVLTTTLAPQVTLNGISRSGATVTQTNNSPLVWQVSDLSTNGSGTITLSAVITGAGWINSSATITGGSGDRIPASNATTVGVYLTGVRFVNKNTPGPVHDGIAWSTAFTNVQDALIKSFSGDEIWVASGTYYPDEGTNQVNNQKSSTFQLKNGVVIYGGFAGNETLRMQRNWASNVTILSGDLDQNDTINPTTLLAVITGTNSNHVVTGSGVNSSGLLDGFSIRNGYANGGYNASCSNQCGGGIINVSGNPTLNNLIFYGNKAFVSGGAIYNSASNPVLTSIQIISNESVADGGGVYNASASQPIMTSIVISSNYADGYGGGMYNIGGSAPIMTSAQFVANVATSDGGGIYNDASNPILNNGTFQGNQAVNGAGMGNSTSSPTLNNVIFTSNLATTTGGGMYNERTSLPHLTDLTFTYNNANIDGGGMYNTKSSPVMTSTTFMSNTAQNGGALYNYNASNPTLVNGLFTGNRATLTAGGIYNKLTSAPILSNITLADNIGAVDTGGIYNHGSHPQIRNSIIWGNTPITQTFNKSGSSPVITTTLIQAACSNGSTCYGIIQADPQFHDSNGADNLSGTADDDVRLSLGSPMIDAGSNSYVSGSLTTDHDHKPRLVDGDGNSSQVIDLGAFEFQRYDLQISAQVKPVQPSPLGAITYTIWFTNAGPSLISGAIITNNLPISVTLTGIAKSGAAITQTISSPLVWQVTDLSSGANGMITLTATITAQAWLTNTATIFANVDDANSANNNTATGFYIAGIRYVNSIASGPLPNGLSWQKAYPDLQSALFTAQPGDEIWVAKGVYRSDEGGSQVNNDVNASFALMNNLAIYGGFVGNESSRSQRNWVTNVTVLSGDIDKNDTVNSNGVVNITNNQSGVNARHVVTGSTLNGSAVLDGFTITAGNANTSGGGLYNTNGSPTLSNLIFSANQAAVEGGGMANVNNSSPALTNVLFYANRAASGGGMANRQGSYPTLSQISFYGNLAPAGKGGGMYNYASFPELVGGSFVANQADNGGGIYNDLSSPNLTNVTFSASQAINGSALYNINNSGPTLSHVTMVSNTASSTGVIFNNSSNPSIRNSIIWGNLPTMGAAVSGGTSTIANSLIERACASGQTCADILQADPKLGTLLDLGNSMFIYPLLPGSHVIDAGNDTYCPDADQRSVDRPQGNHCDLGASETFQADLKATGMSAPEPFTPGGALNFTFNITNSGSYTATGVVVTVTLSAQTVYNSNNCAVGSVSNNILVWAIGDLAVNVSRSCVVTVIVNGGVGGTISSTVAVSGSLHDPVTSNNQAVIYSTSNIPTATPTATNPPTPTPTLTATPSPTLTPTSLPTATATQPAVNTPTATGSPVAPSATPTASATPNPSSTATSTTTSTATTTPKEGTPSPTNTPVGGDQDSDGIADSLECSPACVDSDGDGKQNQLDGDSDGDGIPDKIEANSQVLVASAGTPINSDDDGLADYLDPDSDNDTLSDWLEGYDANFDGKSDVQKANSDSDGDGLDDAFDTLAMNERMNSASPAFPDLDGDEPNWRDADDDNDGFLTRDEVGSDPANPLDLNTNGTPDYLEDANAANRVFLPVVSR